jgi:hypothetical protein
LAATSFPSHFLGGERTEVKKEVHKELESLGQRVGKRVGGALSSQGGQKGSEMGKKAGEAAAERLEQLAGALHKEHVTKQDELGIGGKIGIGMGIVAKHVVEKRGGFLREASGDHLIIQGRTTGAKAEKLLKRSIKRGLARLVGRNEKKH